MLKNGYCRAGILFGLGLPLLMLASPALATVVPIQITTPQQFNSTYTIYNTSSQAITISVSGGASINGAELFAQIADGGVDNSGTATGPTITGLDMTQGIFLGNNAGNEGLTISGDKLLAYDGTNTNGATSVSAAGVLGTLTLNATGITPGTEFTMQLFDVGPNDATFNGNTSNWNVGINHTNFTGDAMSTPFTLEVVASVVPEPTTMGFLVVGGAFCLLRRRSRKVASAD
jgi:hypothetical protein